MHNGYFFFMFIIGRFEPFLKKMSELNDLIKNLSASIPQEKYTEKINEFNVYHDFADSNFNNLIALMNSIQPILDRLNLNFSESTFSNLDCTNIYIGQYFRLFNNLLQLFRPIETSLSDKNNIEISNNRTFFSLFHNMVMNFMSLLNNLDLPNDISIHSYCNFICIMCIFIGNLFNAYEEIPIHDFFLLLDFNKESLETILNFINEDHISKVNEQLSTIINSTSQLLEQNGLKDLLNDLSDLKKLIVNNVHHAKDIDNIFTIINLIRCKMTNNEIDQNLMSLLNSAEFAFGIKSKIYISLKSIQDLVDFCTKQNFSFASCNFVYFLTNSQQNPELFNFSQKINKKLKDNIKILFFENDSHIFSDEEIEIQTDKRIDFNDYIQPFINFQKNNSDWKSNIKTLSKLICLYEKLLHSFEVKFIKAADPFFQSLDCLIQVLYRIVHLISNNEALSMFLSTYITVLKILKVAKQNFNSEKEFTSLLRTFVEVIPSLKDFQELFSIQEKIDNLKNVVQEVLRDSHIRIPNLEELSDENFAKEVQLLRSSEILHTAHRNCENFLINEIEISANIIIFFQSQESFIKLLCDTLNESYPANSNKPMLDLSSYIHNENLINISNTILSIINCKDFEITLDFHFFNNWVSILLQKNTKSDEIHLTEIFSLLKFDKIFTTIIFSFTLFELYSNASSNIDLINGFKQIKIYVINPFLTLKINQSQLINAIFQCIQFAHQISGNLYRKMNILGKTIISNFSSLNLLFQLVEYIHSEYPSFSFSLIPMLIHNMAISLLNNINLSITANIKDEFRDDMLILSENLNSIISEEFPKMQSNKTLEIQDNLIETIRQIFGKLNEFDFTIVAEKAEAFFDAILIFYETTKDNTMKPEIIRALHSFKKAIIELYQIRKDSSHHYAIIKIYTILEKMFYNCEMKDSLKNLTEIINFAFLVYVMKKTIFIMVLLWDQSNPEEKAIDIFNEFSFYSNDDNDSDSEDEFSNEEYSQFLKNLFTTVNDATDLQEKMQKVFAEHQIANNIDLDPLSQSISNLLTEIKNRTELFSSNDNSTPLSKQLETECQDLITKIKNACKAESNSNNSPVNGSGNQIDFSNDQNYPSNIGVNTFDSESMKLALKDLTISELKEKKNILQLEIDKIDSNDFDVEENDRQDIKMHRKMEESIKNVKQAISELTANSSSVDISNNFNIEELKANLDHINEENQKLAEVIRSIESRKVPTQDDEIDLLMSDYNHTFFAQCCELKAYSMNGSINNSSQNDALKKQIEETNESIDRLKKKLAYLNGPGEDKDMINLFGEIRPHIFTEPMIDENIYKKFIKTTKERANALMEKWKKLRSTLDSENKKE